MLRGIQDPRVSCWPDYVASSGREALDLARSVGLWLDPWQALVLDHALGERPDGKWSAFETCVVVPRQNGKGAILEARELAGLFLFGEQLILHSAHEFKTAQEAFRRIMAWIEGKDWMRKRVLRVRTSHGEEGIELHPPETVITGSSSKRVSGVSNGARLRFVARSTGSGRGFSGDCVILDEAYNLGGEAMAALLPTLSARENPQIWYTSSAGMESSEQLLRVHERGVAGTSPRLAYFEWSADPELDLDDRTGWAQANPALGYRIRDEFIEAERAALPNMEFGRERLGYWPSEKTRGVIPVQAWGALADSASKALDPVVFAAAAAPDHGRGSIAAVGARSDGMVHVELVENREGTHWMLARLVELNSSHRPRGVVLDPASGAGALIPGLQQAGIEPVLVTGRGFAQACGAFYDAVMEAKSVRHVNQPGLNAALSQVTKRPSGDAWVFDRRNATGDITPVDAVVLGLQGHLTLGSSKPFFVAWR